jgi:hypothetical protein
MAKRELKFQNHIVNSYKIAGGYAKKWASDLAVGNPDLICSLVRPHLMEVKHRPTWDGNRPVKNPMTAKQVIEMGRWIDAGTMGMLGIVTGEKAINAVLHLCWPVPTDGIISGHWVFARGAYQPGVGFPIETMIEEYIDGYDKNFS